MFPLTLTAWISFLSLATTIIMAQPRVLVFTRTTEYRHDSIPTAIQALQAQQQQQQNQSISGQPETNLAVLFDFTEDPTRFTDENLKRYDAVMFISTTGDDVLDQTQSDSFHTYLQNGGNFIGIHSSSDCLTSKDWFVGTLGARFDYHPDLQEATFLPLDKTHPSLVDIPDRWTFTEEVYYFRSDPRTVGAQVIMTVDESSYTRTGSSTGTYDQGSPHPIAWYSTSPPGAQPLNASAPGSGRSFYTSLGHLNETWQDETFMRHVMGGINWALGSGSTRWANAEGVVGNANETEVTSTMGTSATGTMASVTGSSSMVGSSISQAASATSSSTGGTNAGDKAIVAGGLGTVAIAVGAVAGAIGIIM